MSDKQTITKLAKPVKFDVPTLELIRDGINEACQALLAGDIDGAATNEGFAALESGDVLEMAIAIAGGHIYFNSINQEHVRGYATGFIILGVCGAIDRA